MSEPHRHERYNLRGSLRLLLPALAMLLSCGCASAHAQAPAPRFAEPLHLVVNIPAFRLDVYENGSLQTSYPVTVGQRRDPTPTGHYRLKKVVWNPWWHPPYNRRPKDKITPPGPKNPMGKVKLFFDDLYYLHGTPKESEIGTPASRGCVRLRNDDAIALARIVHRHGMAPLPDGKLDELASTRSWRTHAYPLTEAVPLDIVYDVVEVREGELLVYPDFYRNARFPLTELAARALEGAGYRRDQIDAERLAAALAPRSVVPVKSGGAAPRSAAAPTPLRIPVESVLTTGEGVAAIAGGASGS
ncbi:MAG TPA: L,D-transpeptidase [Thermoanaerobaculia bacterium]|nr:L,D-transpeptidase [Thermoanaerobaculia bacterium]HXT49865.1 L,D-transpeptidase [Thermoanaerobaculia bacterium]